MKKKVLTIITLFVVIVGLFILAKTSNNSARILPIEQDEIKVAYTWAFKNLITSKSSIEDANVNGDITRVEMAKMISNFSKTILHHMPDTSKECKFEDVGGVEPVLQLSIIQACQFGLMGQNVSQFRPLDTITRAEFGTILSRALFGETYQHGTPYYEASLKVLNKLGIIKDISDPTILEKRGWVMIMLKRSADLVQLGGEEIENMIERDHDILPLTLNDGNSMPVIGLGTWTQNNETAEISVYEAIKAGYRLFDTARYYANEEGVGKGIKRAIEEGLVTRDELFITSKIIPDSYYDSDVAIDESLRALGLNYIDLMLIHQPGENDKELYKALEGGVKSGKIRSLGISNYYTKEAFDEITEGVEIMPAVLQNENHIYHQNTELKEYIQQYGTILESWYPFGGRGNTEESFTNPTILKLSEKYGKTPAQIILRWQVQDGYVVIPGSSNVEHIKENIDIFDFELTPNEMKLVNMINENRRYENW